MLHACVQKVQKSRVCLGCKYSVCMGGTGEKNHVGISVSKESLFLIYPTR